ncbi:hypothetical protein HanIR_Chr11g0555211 [Helianthus annuus]|nr:hypothetical protein HanIR_Chr11g0555211 [Helianthus annuus]
METMVGWYDLPLTLINVCGTLKMEQVARPAATLRSLGVSESLCCIAVSRSLLTSQIVTLCSSTQLRVSISMFLSLQGKSFDWLWNLYI